MLTYKVTTVAKKLVEKHEMLEDFLKMIGVQDKNIYEEVEKLEHYISKETSLCLSTLIDFFEENPSAKKQYLQFRNEKM